MEGANKHVGPLSQAWVLCNERQSLGLGPRQCWEYWGGFRWRLTPNRRAEDHQVAWPRHWHFRWCYLNFRPLKKTGHVMDNPGFSNAHSKLCFQQLVDGAVWGGSGNKVMGWRQRVLSDLLSLPISCLTLCLLVCHDVTGLCHVILPLWRKQIRHAFPALMDWNALELWAEGNISSLKVFFFFY